MKAFYVRHVAMVFVVILMGIALVEMIRYASFEAAPLPVEPVVNEPILPPYELVDESKTEWQNYKTPEPEEIAWPQPEPTFHALTVNLAECLRGEAVMVSRSSLYRYVSAYDWGRHSPDVVTDVFMAESGGCVNVVSPTDDWGSCQVHRGDLDRAWVDFDRVVTDVGYAVSVCNKVFWKRINAGMCGLCGWYAGRGWAW